MIGFHGTNKVREILAEGLKPRGYCPHICLSNRPEIAANFGEVLIVNLDGISTDGWSGGETRVHDFISPERINRFKKQVHRSFNWFIDPANFTYWGNRFGCVWRFFQAEGSLTR